MKYKLSPCIVNYSSFTNYQLHSVYDVYRLLNINDMHYSKKLTTEQVSPHRLESLAEDE